MKVQRERLKVQRERLKVQRESTWGTGRGGAGMGIMGEVTMGVRAGSALPRWECE